MTQLKTIDQLFSSEYLNVNELPIDIQEMTLSIDERENTQGLYLDDVVTCLSKDSLLDSLQKSTESKS